MKRIIVLKNFLIGFLSVGSLLLLSQCQPATDEMPVEAQKQLLMQFHQLDNWESVLSKAVLKNAKVMIKLEPHGSIRAKVYVNDLPQYEYLLDREKPQNVLTKSITNANVYIIKNENRPEGLVIDDLETNRRYVLYTWFSPRVAQTNYPNRTSFIQGYAGGLQTISAIQEMWYVLEKRGPEKQ